MRSTLIKVILVVRYSYLLRSTTRALRAQIQSSSRWQQLAAFMILQKCIPAFIYHVKSVFVSSEPFTVAIKIAVMMLQPQSNMWTALRWESETLQRCISHLSFSLTHEEYENLAEPVKCCKACNTFSVHMQISAGHCVSDQGQGCGIIVTLSLFIYHYIRTA